MKKGIKFRLILSSNTMVLAATLCVVVPLIVRQVRTQQQALTTQSDYMMRIVSTEVERFLAEPKAILNNVDSYLGTNKVSLETTESYLERVVAESKTDIGLLYFGTGVPYKDGGFFADHIHWVPPADFDQTTRVWFKDAKTSSGIIVTEPYVDTLTGGIVITLAKAVNKGGSFYGVAGIDITLDKLFSVIEEFKLSPSGLSYLLNKDGLYITNPDSKKILSESFFDENGISFRSTENALKSDSGFTELRVRHGKKQRYLIGKTLSDQTGWIFVSEGPTSELLASEYQNIVFAVIVALCCLAAAFTVVNLIAAGITKPINRIDDAVNQIASGDADLTKRIENNSSDEIGSLAQGFNKFVEKLHSIMQGIQTSGVDLRDAEGELQGSISDMASAIEEIRTNIEGIGSQMNDQSGAVNQTSAAVAEIAENINSLERMIDNQSSGVSNASAAVEEMIGNISSVNQTVETMSRSFKTLSQRAANGSKMQSEVNAKILQITEMSKTLQEANTAISAIAAQTNLLAMNAAIEAAHAGEAGKGFSVVADEIRKLSETSTQQSKKIGEQLKNIATAINSVVESSRLSNTAFSDVAKNIDETDQLVSQISSAMEEQNKGSRRIGESLHIMNDSTGEVRNAGKEMAEGNKLILAEIQNLQNSTNIIKDSIHGMATGAQQISQTGEQLSRIFNKVHQATKSIDSEIHLFKV